jgi:Fe-S oxidoreductase
MDAAAPLCSDSVFRSKALELLGRDDHFDLCVSCGLCASGCPASGLERMDPRRFVRLAALGQDQILETTPWVWMCTMCRRCTQVCPLSIDIPALVYLARSRWPREKRPRGITGSCDAALSTGSLAATGIRPEDFRFVVGDVLEEVRQERPQFARIDAPMDRKGAKFFLNQNSREPTTEPEEMAPLWKVLDLVGADWTYSSLGWSAENYCMFAADDAGWEEIVRRKVRAVEELGCEVWLNTE